MFGEVIYIPIQDDVKYFVVRSLITTKFSHHFFAYKVMFTESHEVVLISKLALDQVLQKYCVLSNYYVVVRSRDHVELIL